MRSSNNVYVKFGQKQIGWLEARLFALALRFENVLISMSTSNFLLLLNAWNGYIVVLPGEVSDVMIG